MGQKALQKPLQHPMGKKTLQNFVNLTHFSVNWQKLDLFHQFDEKYEVKAVK